MSRPPERSWMLATPIGSSAQAGEENAPAAAAAAVLLRSVLRLMFIAVCPPFAEMSSDQVFLQDRSADGVLRVDHVAEPVVAHREILRSGFVEVAFLNAYPVPTSSMSSST